MRANKNHGFVAIFKDFEPLNDVYKVKNEQHNGCRTWTKQQSNEFLKKTHTYIAHAL